MKRRVFAAIEISPEAKEKIAAYTETLRDGFRRVRVGWEKAEKLHLTLKFFGEIDDALFGALRAATDRTGSAVQQFRLTVGGTGVFPDQKRPRILWFGFTDKGALPVVQSLFENECGKIGFQKETRPFEPHLTIARLREPRNSANLVSRHLENSFEPVEFQVSSIALMESKLLPTGSVYQVIYRAEFKK